jgi:hypothetical protein
LSVCISKLRGANADFGMRISELKEKGYSAICIPCSRISRGCVDG